jgi:peptidoglycan/LPS O-acetylase OafA/YrhL
MSAPKLERWEIKASTGSHFDVLDGLRGMAILLVVIFHTFYTNPEHSKIAATVGNLIRSGWMGVPIFFVLSGFLISYPFFKGRSQDPQFCYQSGYASRRLGKILPPFYLSIVIFAVFYWFNLHDASYLQAAWRWAVGLESYAHAQQVAPFNLSYWSLMIEAHFYAILPLLFFLTRGLNQRTTAIVLFCLMLIVPLILRQVAWPENVQSLPNNHTGSEIRFFIERFPLCQLDFFAFGMIFSAIFTAAKPRLEDFQKLAVLGYFGIVLLAFTLCFWGYACEKFKVYDSFQYWSAETFRYLPALSGFLLLFFVFDPDCLGARMFSQGWLRFIGIVSYEWFLFHGPVVTWFHEHTGPSHGSVLVYAWRTLVPLALTFVFSVLVYRYFSLPILHRVRDHLKKG